MTGTPDVPSSSRFSLLIDSYVASMVSCTLRLRCGMPTVLFSKTVSRAFRFICWFYCCNKRGTSSTASVWQISYSPAFVFFPHTVPILWPDLLEELPHVQENIMTERNLMPTEFPLLEEGRQVRGGDPNLITDARYLQDFSFNNDSIGNRADPARNCSLQAASIIIKSIAETFFGKKRYGPELYHATKESFKFRPLPNIPHHI